jgi:hypothetical protein
LAEIDVTEMLSSELTSTHAKLAIEMLLSVHALANLAKGSGNIEHLKAAAGWLPKIEEQLRAIRSDIEEHSNAAVSK